MRVLPDEACCTSTGSSSSSGTLRRQFSDHFEIELQGWIHAWRGPSIANGRVQLRLYDRYSPVNMGALGTRVVPLVLAACLWPGLCRPALPLAQAATWMVLPTVETIG